jgi:TatD DNase family protein
VPLVDSHCHLQFERFEADASEVIQRSLDVGMTLIVPSSQLDTSRKAVELAKQYDRIYAGVGLHPIHVVDEEFDYSAYEALARDPKVVGIGETGLDRYRIVGDTPELKAEVFEKQKAVFQQQLDLAESVNKTAIMHCREAYDDMLALLEPRGFRTPSLIHCFLGNRVQVRRFLALGSYVGFTGIITFENCESELHEVVREVPLDRILLETDSPYLSPVPNRGKRNEPLYVEFIARKIAELKGLSYEEVVGATAANAKKVFRIS